MAFDKFQKTSKKSGFVLDQIMEELISDNYEVGDQLPAEGKLAEMMDVSRTSVREALAALRLTGIIESRAGQGTYICRDLRKEKDNIQSEALTVLKDSVSPKQMFEARRIIEEAIAVFATKRVNNSDLPGLEKALKGMRKAEKAGDTKKFISFNKKFHLSIAKASKNEVLVNIMDSVLSYLEKDLGKEERLYYYQNSAGAISKSYQIHRSILDALEKGNERAVSKAINKHFDNLLGGND